MSKSPNFRAPTVAPSDPRAAQVTKRNLRDAKSRLIAIRRRRAQKLVRAQALVDHQTREIAILDVKLDRLDQIARVIDEGWDAWTPDLASKAHRASPLPHGALSKGALKAMRRAGRPMTSKEIATAIFLAYGLPLPPPAIFGVMAGRVTTNLARAERQGIVSREKRWGGDLWSIVNLSAFRTHNNLR